MELIMYLISKMYILFICNFVFIFSLSYFDSLQFLRRKETSVLGTMSLCVYDYFVLTPPKTT